IRDPLVTGVQTCALPIYSKGATKNKPASETVDVPAEGLVSLSSTYGGDFARLIGPHLKKINQTRFDSRTNQRAALPPPLLREGRSEERRVGKGSRLRWPE